MGMNLEKLDLGGFGINEDTKVDTTQNTYEAAIKVNPDQAAKVSQLSRDLGLTPSLVESDVPKFEGKLKFKDIDLPKLTVENPVTSSLLGDYTRLTIAHDDIDTLKLLENTVTTMRNITEFGVSESMEGFGEAAPELFKQGAEGLAIQWVDSLDPEINLEESISAALPMGVDPTGALSRQIVADMGGELTEQEKAEFEQLRSNTIDALIASVTMRAKKIKSLHPEDLNLLQEGIRAAAESLTVNAPGIALSLLSGGRAAPALIYMGGYTYGSELAGGLAENLPMDEAKTRAGLQAFIEVATEILPAGALEDALSAIRKPGQSAGDALWESVKEFGKREMIGEQAATAWQTVVDQIYGLDDKMEQATTVEERVQIQMERQALTAIATILAGGTQVAGVTAIQTSVQSLQSKAAKDKQQAAQDQANIDAVAEASTNSKLRERDPEAFKEFVEQSTAGVDSNVYIDGLQVQLYMQSFTQEEIDADAALSLLRQQALEASKMGTDVVIPLSEFATYVAPTDHFGALRPSMTLNAELESPFRQAKSEAETQSFIERTIKEAEMHEEVYGEAKTIFEGVKQQLVDTGRYSPQDADAMGRIVPAYATVAASRPRRPVADVYAEMGLRIEGPQTGRMADLEARIAEGRVLQQYERPEDFDALLKEFEALFPEGVSETIAQAATPVERQQRLLESTGLDQSASWTPERLESVIRENLTAQNTTDTRVAFVDPAEFVNATHPDPQEIADEAGTLDLEKIQNDPETPFIWIGDEGTIVAHEGRHRMAALSKAGVTRVPVKIRFMDGTDFADTVDESRSYEFGGQEFQEGSGVPLKVSESYLALPENTDVITEAMNRKAGDIMFQQEGTIARAQRNDIGLYSGVEQAVIDLNIQQWSSKARKQAAQSKDVKEIDAQLERIAERRQELTDEMIRNREYIAQLEASEKEQIAARPDEREQIQKDFDKIITERENQFKQITGERTQDLNSEEANLQRRRDKLIKSKLTANGTDIWDKLSKTPGVKKEELEWLGIEQYLKAGDKFSRQQVLEFVRNNGIKIVEVVGRDGGGDQSVMNWQEPEVWDDSEAYQYNVEDMLYEFDQGSSDAIYIDIDSWMREWVENNEEQVVDNYYNSLAEDQQTEIDEADDKIDWIRSNIDPDIETEMRQFAREEFEEAAEEAARDAYYDNPIYITRSNTDSVYGELIIFGNEDQGYDVRTSMMASDVVLSGIWSESEAQIQAEEYARDNGYVSEESLATEAKWGSSIYLMEGSYDNYRELKLTLPEIEGDFIYETHFPDRNIVAFLRVDDRDLILKAATQEEKDEVGRQIYALADERDDAIEAELSEIPAPETVDFESPDIPPYMWNPAFGFFWKDVADKNFNETVISGYVRQYLNKTPEERRAQYEDGYNDVTGKVTYKYGTEFRKKRMELERQLANKIRTYFLDEFQSDWHQHGRQEGYNTGEDPTPYTDEMERIKAEYSAEAAPILENIIYRADTGTLDGTEFTVDDDISVEPFVVRYDSDNMVIRVFNKSESVIDPGEIVEHRIITRSIDALADRLFILAENGFKNRFEDNNAIDSDRVSDAVVIHIAEAIEKTNKDWLYSIRDRVKAYREAESKYQAAESDVPDAPFKGDAWLALGLKRALVDAAENDYEALAWPNAAVLNDRWNYAAPTLYKNQYDTKMPSTIKKLTKQTPVLLNLDGTPYDFTPVKLEIKQRADGWYDVIDESGERVKDFMREDSAKKFVTEQSGGPMGYWIIPLTPELKEQIKTEGLPMFQETGEVRGYYDTENTLIRLTESADLSTFLHEFAHFMLENERKTGSPTISSINNWFKRNAESVAKEANGYLGKSGQFAQSIWTKPAKSLGAVYNTVPKDQIPTKTRKVFKLMKVQKTRAGLVFPLFAKPEEGPAQGYTLGDWYLAEDQRPTIGAKPLARRPGIHAVNLPVFDQGKANKKGETRVWVEVEMPVIDEKVQAESDSSEVLPNGNRSGITDRLIGPQEAYDYKTNPNASTDAGGWPIAGSMKVLRIVGDEEVAALLSSNDLDHQISNSMTTISDNDAAVMTDQMGAVAQGEVFAQGEIPSGYGPITADDVVAFLDQRTTGDAKLDQAINRAVHEQFARGFETYLMEGKAPSVELRNAFRRFAAWLTEIYRAIKGDLSVNLDREMREVFDRLLATEEAIEIAKARDQFEPLFTDQAMSGMNDEQWAKYQDRKNKVKDKASETLRDKVIGELRRTTERWWKEELAIVQDEERDKLKVEPVYVARRRLSMGGKSDTERAVEEIKQLEDQVKTDTKEIKELKRSPTLAAEIVKLGGLNRTSFAGEGVDPEALKFKVKTPKGQRSLFPRTGGKTADGLAENLNEIGYRGGNLSANDAVDIVMDILSGDITYLDDTVDVQIETLANGIENAKTELEDLRLQLTAPNMKLDAATVRDMVGEQKTDKRGVTRTVIPAQLRGMTEENGQDPDVVATFFGYGSGDELLSDLTLAPSIDEQAKLNAENIMKQRHGDILNDGTIEREADQALRNEERGEMLLTELKALNKQNNRRTIERAAIKDLARERIAQLKRSQILPGKYRKAELRAAKESAAALAKGDKATAAQAKLRQLINYEMGREAEAALKKTDRILKYMGRFRKKDVRAAIMKAGNGYWEQIEKILQRFEFRRGKTIGDVDKLNESVQSWMRTRVEEDGDELSLSDEVLNEMLVTHWKNLTFGQLEGVYDSVRNLEHVAKYSNKIDLLEQTLEFEELRARILQQLSSIDTVYTPQRTTGQETTGFTSIDKLRDTKNIMARWAREGMSKMTKIPFLTRWMDKGDYGMMTQLLATSLTNAQDQKLKLWQEIVEPLLRRVENRSPEDKQRMLRKIYIPEIRNDENDGNLYGHQVLAVALNTGNLGNLQKMLIGEGWAQPDDEAALTFNNPKLQAVLKYMTKGDWELVQDIWDQMNKLYPMLAETAKKASGIAPPKVEATPLTVEVEGETLELAGGYYTLVYDHNRDERAAEFKTKREAEVGSMFATSGSLNQSVTAGSTNTRTKFNAPILLDLGVISQHFQETIHYITHQSVVRQLNKILRDKAISRMMKEKMSPEEINQLLPWLNDIAKDGRTGERAAFGQSAARRLRFGITYGYLGYKMTTLLVQPLGLLSSAQEVGLGRVIKALAHTINVGRGASFEENWTARDFAMANSKVLRHRIKTFDREFADAHKQLIGKDGKIDSFRAGAMMGIGYVQLYVVDLPTWLAAYDKGLAEFEADHNKAVDYADQVVKNTQGSADLVDTAEFLRSKNEFSRLFFAFMTWFSAQWNMTRDIKKQMGNRSITETAARVFYLYVASTLLEMLLRGELTPDDDEEAEDVVAKATLRVASAPISGIPYARDIVNSYVSGYKFNASPALQVVGKGVDSIGGMTQKIIDGDEPTRAQLKNSFIFTGALMNVPGTAQIWATSEHLYEVIEEGEEFTIKQFLFGPEKD